MREITILIRIDEVTGKIHVVEKTDYLYPLGVDREIYLHGIYGYLWAKSCKRFGFKDILKFEK